MNHNVIRIRFQRKGNLWVGSIAMPLSVTPGKHAGAHAHVAAVAPHKAHALAAAGALASRIASDPVISSLLPPGTALALQHAQDLGRAAQAGAHELRAAWDGISHSGIKQAFAGALKHLF